MYGQKSRTVTSFRQSAELFVTPVQQRRYIRIKRNGLMWIKLNSHALLECYAAQDSAWLPPYRAKTCISVTPSRDQHSTQTYVTKRLQTTTNLQCVTSQHSEELNTQNEYPKNSKLINFLWDSRMNTDKIICTEQKIFRDLYLTGVQVTFWRQGQWSN